MSTTPTIRPGMTFTHEHLFEPGWKPGPGEKFKTHCPRATMRIFRVTRLAVWYGFDGSERSSHSMDRPTFEQRYGAQFTDRKD